MNRKRLNIKHISPLGIQIYYLLNDGKWHALILGYINKKFTFGLGWNRKSLEVYQLFKQL
jgi:hypothetical protein